MTIMQATNYNKIQQFVKNSYTDLSQRESLIVRTQDQGFRVGDWFVKNLGQGWRVEDKRGRVYACLKQRRLAVLMAALLNKKKYKLAFNISNIDTTYDILSGDFQLYSIKSSRKTNNLVYIHRLSRAENDLQSLKKQIHELEKTVGLQ